MELTWTRTAPDRLVTKDHPDSDYWIVGRVVDPATEDTGTWTRRWQAIEAETGIFLGPEVNYLAEAKRQVSDYLDEPTTTAPWASRASTVVTVDGTAREVRPPVTVADAMATMLHLARKLDITTGTEREIADLGDLTGKLARVLTTAAHAMGAQVVAGQHQHLTGDKGRVIAAASAETAADARHATIGAHDLLASAIVAYGQPS